MLQDFTGLLDFIEFLKPSKNPVTNRGSFSYDGVFEMLLRAPLEPPLCDQCWVLPKSVFLDLTQFFANFSQKYWISVVY